uniref:VOC family protein n=1 Tax=Acetatifactor sp. TaxID=1872090 RepID=UPI0040563645
MELGTTYIYVGDIQKSVDFYSKLLQEKPLKANEDRWVQFSEVDDLRSEYERLKGLNIGAVSELMYVNVHIPYWYFNVTDPDGNILEITGCYK